MDLVTCAGPLALVGSGEYLPQMSVIEAGLLAGRPPRYVQLATAAVPDGPSVVERWHSLGAAQAARLGVEPVVLPVNDRSDADVYKRQTRTNVRARLTPRLRAISSRAGSALRRLAATGRYTSG